MTLDSICNSCDVYIYNSSTLIPHDHNHDVAGFSNCDNDHVGRTVELPDEHHTQADHDHEVKFSSHLYILILHFDLSFYSDLFSTHANF